MTALLLALLLATSSGAQTGAGAAAADPVAAADAASSAGEDKSRIKCKNYRPTGSRFEKRTCRTIADWERRREEARQAAADLTGRPQVCVNYGDRMTSGGFPMCE